MKLALISAAYWLIVAAVVYLAFFATNLAGPAGTPIYYIPAAQTLAIGGIIYVIGLFLFRRRKA